MWSINACTGTRVPLKHGAPLIRSGSIHTTSSSKAFCSTVTTSSYHLQCPVGNQTHARLRQRGANLGGRQRAQLFLAPLLKPRARGGKLLAAAAGVAHEFGRAFGQRANERRQSSGVITAGHSEPREVVRGTALVTRQSLLELASRQTERPAHGAF